jgi:hypothetical protein
MGQALDALTPGVKNVLEHPMLVAYSYALMAVAIVVGLPLLLVATVLSIVPLFGQLFARPLLMIPIKTLLLGGMLGLATAGFRGSVELDDLTDTYREHGLSLAGAFAIHEATLVVVGMALGAVMLVFVFGGTMSMSAIDSEAASAGFGVAFVALYVVALLVVVAISVFFQFLDVAVVLGDHGAFDAVEECGRLVRNGPVSVLGYTVLRAVLALVILLPGYVLMLVGIEVAEVITWVGTLVVLLLYPIALAVLMSYHVAYYGHRVKAR